jgi:hypothetical protein
MRKMMLQWNITECLARASPACMQLGILRSLFLEPCLLVPALYSSHVAFILFVTTCVPPPSREQLALTSSVLGSDERSRRHLHPARRLSTPSSTNAEHHSDHRRPVQSFTCDVVDRASGWIATTGDALIMLKAARRWVTPRVTRSVRP